MVVDAYFARKGYVNLVSSVYRIELEKSAGACEVFVGSRSIRLAETPSRKLSLSVASREDLTAPGVVSVAEPHSLVGVQRVDSALEPSWVTAGSRALEDVDILPEADRSIARLGEGWAPREMVADSPVRWLGSLASIEVDPTAQLKTLKISGTIGPCLGWGASVSLLASGAEIANHQLDLEDGQPFDIAFNVDGAPLDNGVVLKINRPQPRFTPHDARVLNLLVRAVEVS